MRPRVRVCGDVRRHAAGQDQSRWRGWWRGGGDGGRRQSARPRYNRTLGATRRPVALPHTPSHRPHRPHRRDSPPPRHGSPPRLCRAPSCPSPARLGIAARRRIAVRAHPLLPSTHKWPGSTRWEVRSSRRRTRRPQAHIRAASALCTRRRHSGRPSRAGTRCARVAAAAPHRHCPRSGEAARPRRLRRRAMKRRSFAA
jgi:hypothetical protein